MSEFFLRLALTDDCGKWEPGTILGAYHTEEQFGSGDLSNFLIIRIQTELTIDDLKKMRLRKIADIAEFLDKKDLDARKLEKIKIKIDDKNGKKTLISDLICVHDLSKKHVFDHGKLKDSKFKDPIIATIEGNKLEKIKKVKS